MSILKVLGAFALFIPAVVETGGPMRNPPGKIAPVEAGGLI